VLRTIAGQERLGVNRDPAIVALRETLEERLEVLTDEATERILAEIPAYRDADQQLRRDVRAHVLAHLRASIGTLETNRDVTREDLLFVRPHAARRAKRVSVTEFVQAFYVGERVLWDTALALAHDDESRRAALVFASHLPRYFEVATTHAAEVYLETQEQLAATGERIRRDLLEDLLAGRELEPGPRLDAARAAGLADESSFVVISATPSAAPSDEQLLRGGAAALARAIGGRTLPLAVVRQDEIVVVVRAAEGLEATIAPRLVDVQLRLADAGLPLSVAVSTTVSGLAQIPDAYRELTAIRIARGSAARRRRPVGDERVRVPDAPRRPDHEPPYPARGPRVRRAGHGRGRSADRHASRVRRLRPQRAPRGRQPSHPREHGALPALADRRADRLRPAPRERPDRDPDRGPPGRRRIGCAAQSGPSELGPRSHGLGRRAESGFHLPPATENKDRR
jgi:GGDEF-like domain